MALSTAKAQRATADPPIVDDQAKQVAKLPAKLR
jgi:hypothetical protein